MAKSSEAAWALPAFGEPSAAPGSGPQQVGNTPYGGVTLDDWEDELVPTSPVGGPKSSTQQEELQAQIQDFLAQLPPSERQEVVERLQYSFGKNGAEDPRQGHQGGNDRVDESCEFVARLLEFCDDEATAAAALQGLLPPSTQCSADAAPASLAPPGDFLATRRELRLSPVAARMTPRAASAARCFGRGNADGGAADVPKTYADERPKAEVRRVLEAFRRHDPAKRGTVEREVLVDVLRALNPHFGDTDVEVMLAASSVPDDAPEVDYETFVRWAFREGA